MSYRSIYEIMREVYVEQALSINKDDAAEKIRVPLCNFGEAFEIIQVKLDQNIEPTQEDFDRVENASKNVFSTDLIPYYYALMSENDEFTDLFSSKIINTINKICSNRSWCIEFNSYF